MTKRDVFTDLIAFLAGAFPFVFTAWASGYNFERGPVGAITAFTSLMIGTLAVLLRRYFKP